MQGMYIRMLEKAIEREREKVRERERDSKRIYENKEKVNEYHCEKKCERE